jgi:hypothetical protein
LGRPKLISCAQEMSFCAHKMSLGRPKMFLETPKMFLIETLDSINRGKADVRVKTQTRDTLKKEILKH